MACISSGSPLPWLSFVSYNTISSWTTKFLSGTLPSGSLHSLPFPHASGAYILSGAYIPPEPTYSQGVAYLPQEFTCLWSLHVSGAHILSGAYILSGAHMSQGVACLWSLHTLRSPHTSGAYLPLKPTYSQEPTCLRESPACLWCLHTLRNLHVSGAANMPLEPTCLREPPTYLWSLLTSGAALLQSFTLLSLD